jgi:hypothetical protein
MKHSWKLLALMWLVAAICIAIMISDPFGVSFWMPVHIWLLSTAGMLFLLSAWLFRRRMLVWKVVAGFISLLAAPWLVISLALIIDYRLIIPSIPISITQEKFQRDRLALLHELESHPATKDSVASMLSGKQFRGPQSFENQDEMLVDLMSLPALFHDGHTYVHPLQPAFKSEYFPLQGYWFDDGYYIVRAASRYKELVGTKVVAINGVPIDSLFQKITGISGAENEWNAKLKFDHFVFCGNVLHGLRVLNSSDRALITVVDSEQKTIQVKLSSEPFFAWFFWALKPIDAHDLSPAKLNLRKPNYFLQYDSAKRMVLIPIHAIQNQKGYSFTQLARDLDQLINSTSPSKVVLDLRNNLGGNNELYTPLIDVLQRHKATVKIFVFVGRKTFSAGVNFVSSLDERLDITLVGEPTGAGPNHYGDARHILLPETGLSLLISTRKWQFSPGDSSKYYDPEIRVKYFYSDYKRNRDVCLQALNNL